MYRFNTLAALLLSALFCSQAVADARVQIVSPGEALNEPAGQVVALAGAPRLADALAKVSVPAEIDWAGSRMSTPAADAAMQQLQQQVLKSLNDVMLTAERQHEPEQAYNARLLLQMISRLRVAGRVAKQLDPDWVRIRSELNPRLEGDYTLRLAARQPVVYVIGLTNGAERVALEPGLGAVDYLAKRDWFMGAESRVLYLCQPDGHIERLPAEYWSTLHREPMSGATLFIGLDESQMPAQYQRLNYQIATLLAARIAS